MSRTRLSVEHTALFLADLIELVAKLGPAEKELRARAHDPGAGYSSSSLGGSGGGPTINVDGETIPVTTVEAQVFARQRRDPVAEAHNDVLRAIEDMRVIAMRAHNKYLSTTAQLDKVEPVPHDEIWCASCERANVFTPRGDDKKVGIASVLCGWCNDWVRAHDNAWPPIGLIERRAQGVRITTRVIEEIERSVNRMPKEIREVP